ETDTSIRRALILSLGEYESVSSLDRDSWTKRLLDLYENDPDPGIHGTVEWVLRRWGKESDIAKIETELVTGKIEDERNWYVTKHGHTMVVFHEPDEFLMGSPGMEKDRYSRETLHRRHIDRIFALPSKEVTVKQFQDFLREAANVRHSYTKKYAPEEHCPQTAVTWYEAAAYCRWLSEQESIPEDQMCYPPIPEMKEGMKPSSDYLSRTGYRLPTEAEWEYACRAGTRTSRYYGQSEELLGKYAWYGATSQDRTWPVGSLKPNDFGLFDMHGNVYEWCQEKYSSYGVGTKGKTAEDVEDTASVSSRGSRLLRGGSFDYLPMVVRSAYRIAYRPGNRYFTYGFRPARTHNLSP
ncbi:formylglycine-generating enzyme family protein, partial [Crocinitomicaceae bacterium]|nr:formylglycine-generating enzyme family protein [Crocinitomicaceae bacterium]